MKHDHHGLGRLFTPDPRDKKYPIAEHPKLRALSTARPAITKKTWPHGDPFLDQGDTSGCVGFAWSHYRNAGPVVAHHRMRQPEAAALYLRARQIDEYPGEADDGTSVRAGAEVLKADGKIAAYRWAQTFQDIIDALLHVGPVVMGTNWYDPMFDVDAFGFVSIGSGQPVGGHAWLLVGVDTKRQYFLAKNSWGKHAMENGMFRVRQADLELLFELDGEACIAEGEVK